MHMEILEELLRMGEVGRGDCEGEIGGGEGRGGWVALLLIFRTFHTSVTFECLIFSFLAIVIIK